MTKHTPYFILVFALLLAVALAQSVYPPNTRPDYGDGQTEAIKKILKLLNDAKTGNIDTTSRLPVGFTSNVIDGATEPGKRVVTFIFSADFVGTLNGVAFTGAADSYLELRAPEGSTLASVFWVRTAGTVRVVQF